MSPQRSSRFRFPRLFGGFLALVLLFAVLPFESAFADGGDFTITFRAARATTYNHTTGVGGAFGDVVTSLQGGDFTCGDKVVYLTSIHVDGNPTAASQAVQLNFTFNTQSTGQPGAGFRSLVSAGPNTGDPAHTADGTFPSTVNVVTNNFAGDPGLVGVQITGLEANETFILRLVVELGCDPGLKPTGNIQAALASAAVISPVADVIPGGQQTTPLMSAGQIAQPAIAITKIADNASVSAGATIGFTIGVTNPGNAAATAVHVTDALPGGTGIDWSINPAVTGCSITGAPPTEQLVCDFASLASLGSVSIHVTSGTTGESCGTLPNTAVVTTGNDGSAEASASIDVLCPDVTVTKVASQPIIPSGGTATFTIGVVNNGAGIARSVTLTDPLPGGIPWIENSASCIITGATLICTFGDLAPGASASVVLTGQAPGTCIQIPNTAVVSATNEPQSARGNNTASATISVTCPALSIAKVADDPSVSAGEVVGFMITVFNGGNQAAPNVGVIDVLPTNLGLNWSLDNPVPGCSISGPLGAQVLNCVLPTVAANGGTVAIHVVSPTSAATCGLITNRAGLATAPPLALATINVDCPDVRVVKTADDGTINAGDTAAFTIVVTNLGPGTATGVTLNDTLPAGVSWSEDSADCSIGGTTLTCTFVGPLAPNATRTIHVTGATDATDCGQLDNTASVLASNEPADVLENNSSTASVTVNCPDVTVTKTADVPTINAGATAAFTVVVRNLGPGTATNVTLNDPLPSGIVWSEDSPDCSIALGVLSCNFGPLGPGEIRTIHLTGLTDAADCGRLGNTSTVAASNEPSSATGNNSSTASITVVCPPPPPAYGTNPKTLPEERPYDPAPGGQPAGNTGQPGGTQDQPSADPGTQVAGTTVPVTPVAGSGDSGNPVVEAVIGAVQSPVTLPRTGAEVIQQAIAGLILIGAGLLLLAVRRRRSPSTPSS